MSGVFISHSADEATIARLFVSLLTEGLGLASDDVFCTSIPGQIPPGAAFKDQIKAQLNASSLFIPIISESFGASRFCMFELGAAWAASKNIIPVLVPPVTYSDMAPLLSDTQAVRIENEVDLSLLRSEVIRRLHLEPKAKAAWTSRARRFLHELPLHLARGETWLYALRGFRNGASQERIGCFNVHRVPNRANVVTASGRAYWVNPKLSLRGEWTTEESVARQDRMLLHYSFKSPTDGVLIDLSKPASHEGIINLARRTDFAPLRGDVCFAGYVHDLFEWRDNTPSMYAERVPQTWDSAIEVIESNGRQLYQQMASRLGVK